MKPIYIAINIIAFIIIISIATVPIGYAPFFILVALYAAVCSPAWHSIWK